MFASCTSNLWEQMFDFRRYILLSSGQARRWERSPKGVAFGILWNGGVARVNVATLKGVAFGISHTITKRLDLTSSSSLGFRLRPHNRRDPKLRRDRQSGTKKKRA